MCQTNHKVGNVQSCQKINVSRATRRNNDGRNSSAGQHEPIFVHDGQPVHIERFQVTGQPNEQVFGRKPANRFRPNQEIELIYRR